MKKVLLLMAVAVFTLSFIACTPEDTTQDEQQTDKECNSPPNDRNCNGIPDNEEN